MPPALRTASLLLAALGSAQALIVHEGRIVPEWPSAPASPALAPPLAKPGAAAPAGFYPSPKGTLWGLTLLVDFSDQPATFPVQDVKDWLNLKGFSKTGCNGSVRDYFSDLSNGQVDFQNQVFGYYRAKNPKAYYDQGPGYAKARELLDEMIAHFDPTVDFSRFDNDKDGKTEAISIVYAGPGKTWGQGLWPHAGTLGRKLDGVTADRYMMTDLDKEFTLYVFAHECGHMIFGWPDLYWFGDYCLMGNRIQDKNPVAVNDFYRADQGWIPVADLSSSTQARHSLPAGAAGFRYVNPAKPSEMFFWSNVQATGRWSGLKGSGLLLYHFDAAKGGNTSATTRSLFVVEADNDNHMASEQWPTPGSAASDLFPSGGRTEFSAATFAAASRWNDGSPSGLRLHSISPAGDPLFFSVGAGIPASLRPDAPPLRRGATALRIPIAEGAWINPLGIRRPASSSRRALAPGLGL